MEKYMKTVRKIKAISYMIILSAILGLGMPFTAEAADAEYRMMHGEQDAIIVGTIKEISSEGYFVQTEHVISCKDDTTLNRQLPAEEIPSEILVEEINYRYSYHEKKEPEAGDFLVISVDKKETVWQQVWMAFEVSSADIASLEIVPEEDMTAGIYAWQLFIRSDGETAEFTYNSMSLYVDGELVFDETEYQKTLKEKTIEQQQEAVEDSRETENDGKQSDGISVAIIGGADGPTSVFLAGKIGSQFIFAVITVVILILAAAVITAWRILRKKRITVNKEGHGV